MSHHRAAGTYALVLRLDREIELEVGRLGRRRLLAGVYVYAGSALGGLAARIERHLRETKPFHWHIDYLRPHTSVVAVYAALGSERLECILAGKLSTLPGAWHPVPGFGSSDCRCPSHLVYLPAPPTLEGLLPGLTGLSRLLGGTPGAATRATHGRALGPGGELLGGETARFG